MKNKESKSIVHMDLDSFFVAVERLHNRKLQNIPLLIGGKSSKAVVASCSYEARKFGIHSAMPMKIARRLCPKAVVINGDGALYSKYSQLVTEVIAEQVPLYEKSSIDEFYIDLSGMERFHNSYLLAQKIKKDIKKETGLDISFGQSINKTVSKVATNESKPNGYCKVALGAEKYFLSPLRVDKLPQVGEKTFHSLKNMGVWRVKTLQQMPVELVEQFLGKSGRRIWLKAQGVDHSPVVPYRERKSISKEQTFDIDTADMLLLQRTLLQMTEQLAFELRKQRKLTAVVAVKIRYADFDTRQTQSRIAYTANDKVLIAKVKHLFQRLYQRRLLIRLIGVRFSHLVSGGHQIALFDHSAEEICLYQSMDQIRMRFGIHKIGRAAALSGQKKTASKRRKDVS